MKKGDRVFVYGTLRKGERADLSKSARQFSVTPLGLTCINGLLYHLGAFPGVKLLPSSEEDFNSKLPVVCGEIFLVRDDSVCSVLDAYEGYDSEQPSRGLYDRKEVFTESGEIVWVYTYNGSVTDEQLIETGDWKNPRLSMCRQIPMVKYSK